MTGLGDLIRSTRDISTRDIRYIGRIDEDNTDYPVFSDRQLERMQTVTNIPNPHLDGAKFWFMTIAGHQIPYLNPNEYVEIEDEGVVIRFEDTLIVLLAETGLKSAETK